MSKILSVVFFGAVSICQGTTFYVATNQSGAQTQIDVNHSSTWVFTPNVDFDFGGGLFYMKAGSSSTADVVFSLYQGTDATGTLQASVTLTNTQLCAQASCGQFNVHQFFEVVPRPALVTGTTYFAALTSNAVDTQNEAYFIKTGGFFMGDANGVPADPQPVGGGAATTPEPVTFGLIGFGLVCLALARRSRTRLPSRSLNRPESTVTSL